jgi:DNA-binding transcriptional regulator YiaG
MSVNRKAEHTIHEFGFPVTLFNAALEEKCPSCGDSITIPDYEGLAAAVAMCRIAHPFKLSGSDIRFVRNTMGSKSKDVAEYLSVAPETYSRWESDRPISPASERVFRMLAYASLKERANGVKCDASTLATMKILSAFDKEELRFEFVRAVLDTNTATYAKAA